MSLGNDLVKACFANVIVYSPGGPGSGTSEAEDILESK
jgi:hypothetical protein